jgi:hypothetical protein
MRRPVDGHPRGAESDVFDPAGTDRSSEEKTRMRESERIRKAIAVRWLRAALIAVAVSGPLACEIKTADFFEPATGDVSQLPDVDAPVFSGFYPVAGLMKPLNIDHIQFSLNDPAGSNGAAASGIDPNSVTLTMQNGSQLPLVLSNNAWTTSLAGVADGAQTMTASASDRAGNSSTYVYVFTLKTADPSITFSTTPQHTWQSSDPSVSFDFTGTIADPNIATAVGAVYKPGPNGTCGDQDDVIWPKGSAGGQVSENTFDYLSGVMLNGMFHSMYTAYNGVPVGGQANQAGYCLTVDAADDAVDGMGAAFPNTSRLSFDSRLTWLPPAPTTGTIAGHVTLSGGAPVAGATVTAGSATTTTGADGSYSLTGLQPGPYTVAVSNLPTDVTCSPSSKSTSVTAGNTSTVDFSCDMQPTFAINLTGLYRHFMGFSRVCLHISTTPAQPNAPYSASVTGPAGGVSGSGQHSGNLDGAGAADVTNDIFLYGSYDWVVSILGQMASTSINVTSTPGTCTL